MPSSIVLQLCCGGQCTNPCFPGVSFIIINPFSNNKILDSSKLNEFADDDFKFDENCTKFSEWLENTVEKGEIAGNEQFLLFPQCFSKDLYCRHVKTRACLGKD